MDASLIYQNLAVFAAFLLIYSLIAGRFESRLINGPLLFLLMGCCWDLAGSVCCHSRSIARGSSCWQSSPWS